MENQVPSASQSALQPNSFTPPRHWVGMEELKSSYWDNPETREVRAQEFAHKPIETIAAIDASPKGGLARRDFLTLMGASMAMASLSCARRPVHKIIPYVVQPEEIVPGVANWYATTCPETGAGLLAKVREGRPIKLEGNPDHPLSRGKLNARGQAAVLDLYDTDRLRQPVGTDRAGGSIRELKWQDVDAEVGAKLRGASGKVRILSGSILSPSTRRLIQEFLGAFGSANNGFVEYEALSLEEISIAQAESYGSAVMPRYRFDQAEVVLSLGADFMGVWPDSIEYEGDWAKNRRLNSAEAASAKLSKMFCFESTVTTTGANADERFPIRPGDEVKVAMAIAYALIVGQKRSHFAGDGSITSALSSYSPDAVSKDTGVPSQKFTEIAEALWGARGKGLVVGGSVHTKGPDAVALQLAVNLLNSALENEGSTVDGNAVTAVYPTSSYSNLEKLIAEMNAGAVEVLILHDTNPAYTLPKSLKFEEALKKVPYVVACSDRVDETASLANTVAPIHHFLENWGDAQARKGLYSLQQPTLAPLHSTRAFQDSLLSWLKAAGRTGSDLAGRISQAAAPANTWHDYLVANWRENVSRDAHHAGSFETFWDGALRDGVVVTSGFNAKPSARSFRSGSLSKIGPFKAAGEGLLLSLYAHANIHDGRSANNPWLQELPQQITTVTWDNYVNLAPALAAKYGITDNDVVEVKSGEVSIEIPAKVQPGMHPNAISVAVGYGRTKAGRVGSQTDINRVGIDAYPFVKAQDGRLLYAGSPVTIRKTGARHMLAETQWHGVSENRPIINDITLAEFKANPGTANHTDPHLRLETVPTMWPTYQYNGYRWGMAIDLNSCTGCNACVVACQAENNIPVVGRNNVRVSRQMHWIRIDRYYSGTPESPDVIFQPMLCQHCENAPCETVCPVLATVHDDEGLNSQVYNRCVGTRYCQNNCPYKVRRFNFFDHWKSYETTQNLVWNPDVTVRQRGIMEKCTFCIQRIQESRNAAKDRGDKIRDGEVLPACAQTCPTEAITFGNINDPNSRVSKLRADQRAFRSLEVLNTRPAISYLTKVRNKVGGHGHHGGAEHEGGEEHGAKSNHHGGA